AMVMGYWRAHGFAAPGSDAGDGSIMAAVYSDALKGTPGSAMRRYFEQSGFRAFVFQGEWSDLERQIGQGRPLIVALRESRSFHYAVVAGVDTQQGLVLLNDPARRKLLQTDRAEFERAWNAAGRWTLLAVPGQRR
ncbi:MAG TPA: cysteine peptidase family C39 domain-containing protein, partial [Terriglobia bacterium]|nr:cysteine peptidase family C39 domain-containing protein [Terriglobia bacterium]